MIKIITPGIMIPGEARPHISAAAIAKHIMTTHLWVDERELPETPRVKAVDPVSTGGVCYSIVSQPGGGDHYKQEIIYQAIPLSERNPNFKIVLVVKSIVPQTTHYRFKNGDSTQVMFYECRTSDGKTRFSRQEAVDILRSLEQLGETPRLGRFPKAVIAERRPETHWSRGDSSQEIKLAGHLTLAKLASTPEKLASTPETTGRAQIVRITRKGRDITFIVYRAKDYAATLG